MEFLDDAERYYIYTHTHTHTHGGYNENGFSVSVLRPAEQMISRSSFFFAARSRWSCYYTRRTLFFRYVCAATFTRFCQSNARRRKFRAMSGFACARALIARAEPDAFGNVTRLSNRIYRRRCPLLELSRVITKIR